MTGSAGALDRSLFAIRDTAGAPIGVAFLVASDIAVTCAHVVNRALDGIAATEGSELVLDQVLAVGVRSRRHTARVQRLLPEEPGGAGDIAILRLAKPPAEARAVRLVDAEDLWGHPVRAFGFPARRDLGVWHDGRLRGRQGAGWIQVDAAGSTGYPIVPGFSGTPVWDDELAGVVGMVVAADTSATSAGYVIPTEWLLDAWPDLRADAIQPSPYRGLLPFREMDQELFFGRETQSGELADQISGRPILTVIGASGCGKTSLVQAGVVPRLKARDMAVAVMRAGDGSSPVNALAAALVRLLEPEKSETEQLAEQPALAQLIAEHGLQDVVPRVLAATDTRRLVVVLDQAEQLLEQPPDPVDALLAALFPDPQPAELGVVLTLRADYLDAALRREGLAGPLSRGSYLLSDMTSRQIAEAVTGPVERVPGVEFEAGLVTRMVTDVGSGSGVLPLLGNVLALLWQRQQRGVVTHQAYEDLGGLSGSLARYAEEVWTGIPEAERETARRLFLALVRTSRDGLRTSRRAATGEQLGEQGWSLAQRLVTTRIVVAGRDAEGRPTVELAHDALIERWTRLRDWVDTDREFRMWQEELRDDHARWQRAGQPAELLLRGDPLRTARSWLAQRSADLSPAERDFITASTREYRSSGRRRRLGVTVTAGVLVVALITTALLVVRDRAARAEQAVAASRAFAAAAAAFAGKDQARSALLALRAYRESPTSEARQALFQSYLDTLSADTVLSGWPGDSLLDTDATRDGRVGVVLSAAGQSDDRYLTLWTREPGKPVRTTRLAAEPASQHVRMTNGGGTLVLAGEHGIVLLNTATGERNKVVETPADSRILRLSVADDNSVAVASIYESSILRIVAWDLRTGRVIAERQAPPVMENIINLDLAPDLHSLVVVYYVSGREGLGSQRAEVWDLLSGRTSVLEDRLDNMQVTPGGTFTSCTTLPTGDHLFITRRVADGSEITRAAIDISCQDFEIDQSGTSVAFAYLSSLVFYDLTSPRTRHSVTGIGSESALTHLHHGGLTDGRGHSIVLVGNLAGNIQIVPLRSNGVDDISPAGTGSTKLSPNGQLLVSTSADERRLRVTRAEDGQLIAEVSRPILPKESPHYVASTEFSEDGTLLAHRVSADRVIVYRLPTLNVVSEIATSPTNVPADEGELFFDGAGRLIARIGSGVTCWDPRTGSVACQLDLTQLGLVPAGLIPTVTALDQPDQLLVVVPGRSTVLTLNTRTRSVVNSLDVGADLTGATKQGTSPYLWVIRKNSGIELWDIDKRRRVFGPLPEANPPWDYAALLRPPGSVMIVKQSRVVLWQAEHDSPVYSLQLPTGWKTIGAFPDGSRLVVMANPELGPAFVIDLRPKVWADHICHIVAGRELTPNEVRDLPAPSNTSSLCPR